MMGRGRAKSNTMAGAPTGNVANILAMMQPWANALSAFQLQALASFQDQNMRVWVQNGMAPEVAGHLQDALLQAHLGAETIIHQGTSEKTSLKDAKNMIGKTVENTKFTTGHLTENQARANMSPTGGTIYKYTLPKGASAAAPSVATGKGKSKGEVVTKQGAKFKATKAYKQGNNTVIEMTYVG